MGKKRDRSQLKFQLLLHIRDYSLGISKYKLKKIIGIPTTKQFDQLIEDLINKKYVRLEKRELPGNQKETGNYYILEEKGIVFLEKAENLLSEFLNMDDLEIKEEKNFWNFSS